STLTRGNSADPADFRRHLGRSATRVEAFLSDGQRTQVRERVESLNLLVWMRASVATVRIATGALSLGIYPVEQSMQLLDEFGLEGPFAWSALYLGAILDLALGVVVLLAPPRWLPSVCRAQIAVIVTYTLLITLRIPHWWMHPFGPVLKNLPLLVGIAMLSTFYRRT
ncbi:MAG TPA: DoxX-like family protein, partial [Acidovorax sp.]|nr:DoxX-like family protein [Acidovorax sp.]